MANGEFKYEGFESAAKYLQGLEQALQDSIEDEALEAGAEPIRDEVEKLTPVSKLQKQHAKAHIVIKRANRKGVISIQPDDEFYYLIFVEFGTSSIVAEPYFEKALRNATPESRKRIIEVVKRRVHDVNNGRR